MSSHRNKYIYRKHHSYANKISFILIWLFKWTLYMESASLESVNVYIEGLAAEVKWECSNEFYVWFRLVVVSSSWLKSHPQRNRNYSLAYMQKLNMLALSLFIYCPLINKASDLPKEIRTKVTLYLKFHKQNWLNIAMSFHYLMLVHACYFS